MSLTEELEAHVLYRVSLRGGTGQYEVITLGTFGIDDSLQGVYDLEDLPQSVQQKIAVLRVCKDTTLDGFGRRIDDNTFWIYK
jgi:hypothetical protein|tara:strand:+ start:382 stop:630 length:249 start_codon:yes stop_codon:yes gene_type:complete